VRNALWTAARAVPSLDLRFADNKSLVDAVTGASLVTFTRASSGTFVNSAGVLQTATTNEPRFDHNPTTGESLGLLVEEARTNSIRNNTMVGAVAGTPGTLPTNWPAPSLRGVTQTLAVSTVSGVTCLDFQLSGTPTSTGNINIALCEPTNSIAASSGQTWTGSTYVVLSAGSLTNIDTVSLYIREGSVTNTFLTSSSVDYVPAAGALLSTRWTNTRTLTNALTAFVNQGITLGVTTGQAIDITLRIGLPQLELGAFATSVIPTTTATVTRSASLADLISSAIANNIRSFYVEFSSPVVGTRGVVSLNDNTANERADLLTSGTDPRLVVHDGGAEQANINGGTVAAGVRTRVAVRISTNDFAISINGGAVVSDTSGTLPTVDRLMLGRTQAGEYLNGRIARFTGWAGLLPDSTLQSITQP
jgi:hypothetical protein